MQETDAINIYYDVETEHKSQILPLVFWHLCFADFCHQLCSNDVGSTNKLVKYIKLIDRMIDNVNLYSASS